VRFLHDWFSLVVAAALFASTYVLAQQPASILPRPSDLPSPQTAIVFGQHMIYHEAGEGPALVLVHGFGSQALFDRGRVIKPLHKIIT
jgi:hypothetical protein